MRIPAFEPSRRVEQTKDGHGYTVFIKPPELVGNLPEVSVLLTSAQYLRYVQWNSGKGLIQELLPDLTASEREMLMTGLGDEDFRRIAGGDDE